MKANFDNIYSKIGYLFYAIASENGNLSSIEYERLRKLVAQKWWPASNSEAALQSHLIEALGNSIWIGCHSCMTSKTAFELFGNCYFPHQLNFGPSLREKILDTCRAIAKDFTRWNSQGSVIMRNLEHLLNERAPLRQWQPGLNFSSYH
jgi:hypothetical protein